MLKFAESGHPVFRGTSPLSRGSLKSKGGGKVSIHFNAEPQTAELLFRTVISDNQLSIHGAVARWCNHQVLPAAEPHVEHEAATEVPPELVSRLTKHKTLDTLAQGDLAQKRDELFVELLDKKQNSQKCVKTLGSQERLLRDSSL